MRIRAPGRSVYRQAIPIAADAARGTVARRGTGDARRIGVNGVGMFC